MTTPTCHRCHAPLDSLTETRCLECRHELHLEILRYREFLRTDLAREAGMERVRGGPLDFDQ